MSSKYFAHLSKMVMVLIIALSLVLTPQIEPVYGETDMVWALPGKDFPLEGRKGETKGKVVEAYEKYVKRIEILKNPRGLNQKGFEKRKFGHGGAESHKY